MPTLSIEKNRNLKSAIPNKGGAQSLASRRKASSGAVSPKKQLRPVGSKPARATGAQQPTKADEPRIERIIRPGKRPRSGDSHATQIAPTEAPAKAEAPEGERATKQERMLSLLSQPAGVSIAEMMQATNWQQHSVRGFLAGTVKRKLGFSLTSEKPDDGVRRYRIKARRGC
jgi:hypothetical protein